MPLWGDLGDGRIALVNVVDREKIADLVDSTKTGRAPEAIVLIQLSFLFRGEAASEVGPAGRAVAQKQPVGEPRATWCDSTKAKRAEVEPVSVGPLKSCRLRTSQIMGQEVE